MRHIAIALVVSLALCMPAAGRAVSDADAACGSAMAPYYAALLASARVRCGLGDVCQRRQGRGRVTPSADGAVTVRGEVVVVRIPASMAR